MLLIHEDNIFEFANTLWLSCNKQKYLQQFEQYQDVQFKCIQIYVKKVEMSKLKLICLDIR